MKKTIKINTEIIGKLNPCEDRFSNWLYHYDSKTYTIEQFLELEHITYRDKLWVTLRLVSNEIRTVYATDRRFSAVYAACSPDAIAARKKEESNQIRVLLHLIGDEL